MAETSKKVSVFKKIAGAVRKIPGAVRGFFKGVKTEYSKIVFPNRETLIKQTTAVIVISILVGALIFLVDFILRYGLNVVL